MKQRGSIFDCWECQLNPGCFVRRPASVCALFIQTISVSQFFYLVLTIRMSYWSSLYTHYNLRYGLLKLKAIFFQGYSLFFFFFVFSYFCSFMLVWGLRFLGLRLGFRGLGFELMGFATCGMGLLGFFGWGSLYKHKRITWENMVRARQLTPLARE